MIQQPNSSQRPGGRASRSVRRWAAGLAVAAAAVVAGAPPALAVIPAPPSGGGPVIPPPPVSIAAYLPSWAVAAVVASTIVLSVATTLITLAVHRLRTSRTVVAGPELESDAGDTLTSRY